MNTPLLPVKVASISCLCYEFEVARENSKVRRKVLYLPATNENKVLENYQSFVEVSKELRALTKTLKTIHVPSVDDDGFTLQLMHKVKLREERRELLNKVEIEFSWLEKCVFETLKIAYTYRADKMIIIKKIDGECTYIRREELPDLYSSLPQYKLVRIYPETIEVVHEDPS